MKKIFLLLAMIVPVLSGTAVFAVDFSADMVTKTPGGELSGKIFVTGEKVRTEMMGAVSIARMDKNVAWVIMPQQKMYMEQAIDPRTVSAAKEKMPGEIERQSLGNESVDGRQAEKYRIVYETNGIRQTILQWIDAASPMPLKVAAEDGSWSVEYRNMKIGPQDPSLFEVPGGYSKFAIPKMGNLGNMPGQGE